MLLFYLVGYLLLVIVIFYADPVNSAVITQCGGIPLVIECLSSPVRNTVSYN